jgi:ubiquinone/menaquinone biosynthesis C-methylase UbiE
MRSLLSDINKDEITVLDLGTGSADVPMYLLDLGRQLNQKFRITAVDNHPQVLEVARERTKQFSEITIEAGNILDLNYPPDAFDVVICSLTLHHFSREDAMKILRSMNFLCRIGFLANDLDRSRLAAWITKCYTHVTTRNRMTLTDSYRSVLRGFTKNEIRDMACAEGLHNVEIYPHPFFRYLLVGRHQSGAGL